MLTDQQIEKFQFLVWDYYHAHARSMPWRDDPTPYHVLVSELMLQQTQVSRVLPKYQLFIKRFSNVAALAHASLAEVLSVWQGLGYNRRAQFLYRTAHMVQRDYAGQLPTSHEELTQLPGIGSNTAGAIMAYAYNQPVVFVETNIRSVYFHHFFAQQLDIGDKQLLPIIDQTLDRTQPRQWYWALMDYGSHLKQLHGNNITQSRHYTRQSRFEGSRRQLRGRIIRDLITGPQQYQVMLDAINDQRAEEVMIDLQQEGLIMWQNNTISLTDQVELP